MSDLIRREDAIKAIKQNAYKHTYLDQIIDIVKSLPSAENNKTHNGYTNYPTWLLAATIDNNEQLYKFFKNLSSLSLTTICSTLEELLETDIKIMKDINESLLNYAKEQINIPEIARSIKEN